MLMRMPRLGQFVFSISGEKPFQSFSAAKHELDELSGVSIGGCMISGAPVSQAWPGSAWHRTSPTKSSITRLERSPRRRRLPAS